jgi:hypothetical protein
VLSAAPSSELDCCVVLSVDSSEGLRCWARQLLLRFHVLQKSLKSLRLSVSCLHLMCRCDGYFRLRCVAQAVERPAVRLGWLCCCCAELCAGQTVQMSFVVILLELELHGWCHVQAVASCLVVARQHASAARICGGVESWCLGLSPPRVLNC